MVTDPQKATGCDRLQPVRISAVGCQTDTQSPAGALWIVEPGRVRVRVSRAIDETLVRIDGERPLSGRRDDLRRPTRDHDRTGAVAVVEQRAVNRRTGDHDRLRRASGPGHEAGSPGRRHAR